MLKFCTIIDKTSVAEGLAMHKSLKGTLKENFALYWLCMDKETYDAICKTRRTGEISEIRPLLVDWLEGLDPEFAELRKNPPKSEYDNAWSWFGLTVIPYFINYCLTSFCEEGEFVSYIVNK